MDSVQIDVPLQVKVFHGEDFPGSLSQRVFSLAVPSRVTEVCRRSVGGSVGVGVGGV